MFGASRIELAKRDPASGPPQESMRLTGTASQIKQGSWAMEIGSIPVLLSVVVPCFNEEQGIEACHERLSSVLIGMGEPYEIVYVDDGSKDGTAAKLGRIEAIDPHAVVLRLSRNFGHQAAVSAGLEGARGDAIVIIDSDLQDPPELIPEMMDLWRQGFEVVYGVRASRAGETKFKLWTARLFYRLINRLSDVRIPLDTGDFRLLDRKAVDALLQMPERHRLLRGMSSWIGFRQTGIRYKREERFAGETKYPLKKMLALAVDGIVSFSTLPLRFVTLVGFLSAMLAFFGIAYSLIVRLFTHEWVRGWAISFIGMLFMSGVQLLSLGILGEYIARIYNESKQRPLYLLRNSAQRATQLVNRLETFGDREMDWADSLPETVKHG
jgi:dolichol-phosphate mannosyltransferase